MPQVETGSTEVREVVGKVVVERIPIGCRVHIVAPAWSALLDSAGICDSSATVCGVASRRFVIHNRPDGIAGNFRTGYGLNYNGDVNLMPLLVNGLKEGVTFEFPGVFSSEFLKKVAQKYRDFLSANYGNYSRALRVEYTITAGIE